MRPRAAIPLSPSLPLLLLLLLLPRPLVPLVACWRRLQGRRWCWRPPPEYLFDAPRSHVEPCRPTIPTCSGPQAARPHNHLDLENGAESGIGIGAGAGGAGAAAARSAPGGGGGEFASRRGRTRKGVAQATRPRLLLSVLQRRSRVETYWRTTEE